MKVLENKLAIITGAGSGIGKSVAKLFALQGASVILVDIRFENVEAVANEITDSGGSALCYAADVSKSSDMFKFMTYVTEKYSTLDILVNDAGLMDDFTPVAEVSDQLWERVLSTNLSGAFYLSREAVKLFLRQGAGNIINIASISGLFGGRAGLAYTASKHGLIGLTKSIAYQYADKGIRCNAIAPGAIETNLLFHAQLHPFGYERMRAGAENTPGPGTPEQVAKVALFLASNNSDFVNGAVLTVDGGWTAY
ncbi:glucose 1-dehydrogenase [Pedobacter sp.]|uniref:glucose 1-dehydrogenase n=1 Tax=Pedobacter sp. TaxID=1411316 RepID=UPI003D7FBFF8